MIFSERIKADLGKALKAGDKGKVAALRLLLSALNYKRIEKREKLEKGEVLAVLRVEEKKRLESIEAYEKGNRLEKADQERKELEIIRQYLPKMIDEKASIA